MNSKLPLLLVLVQVFLLKAVAQIPYTFDNQNSSSSSSVPPPSNSIPHLSVLDSELWAGTGKGLASTSNGGSSWVSYRGVPEFTTRGIFAVVTKPGLVWTSNGFTQDVNGQNVQTGAGYTYSTDNGSTWTHKSQTLDAIDDSIETYGINTVKFLPIVVDEQNVTFDVALSDSFVWIASWSSGLRKSSDLGTTWERTVLPSDGLNSIAPTDSLGSRYLIDPRLHNNFLVFSVYVQNDSTIWTGTAGGVNKSLDGGRSWTKFTTLNQSSPILGNWVISIAGQQIDTVTRIWITNWRADLDPNEEFGVSYSDDGGRIWNNFLRGIRAYGFAFKGPVAYVSTEDGIYRTDDGGTTWRQSGTIVDNTTRQAVTSRTFYSVGVIGDTLYAGGTDGFVKTIDNASHGFGEQWTVLRAYQPAGAGATYAYPNPFSPDDEVVRFHYATGSGSSTVTIEIFDFGMNRVRTLIKDATRVGGTELDEIWDGRDDVGIQVANGVYFYRVQVGGNEPVWSKVMVLQ